MRSRPRKCALEPVELTTEWPTVGPLERLWKLESPIPTVLKSMHLITLAFT